MSTVEVPDDVLVLVVGRTNLDTNLLVNGHRVPMLQSIRFTADVKNPEPRLELRFYEEGMVARPPDFQLRNEIAEAKADILRVLPRVVINGVQHPPTTADPPTPRKIARTIWEWLTLKSV